jgi:hypothetical protein
MSSGKRKRQRANREAAAEARQPSREITDDDLDRLLMDVTVRADCEHASTRTTPDGLFLTRCALGLDVAGGCPRDCRGFEKRRVGGIGMGAGG